MDRIGTSGRAAFGVLSVLAIWLFAKSLPLGSTWLISRRFFWRCSRCFAATHPMHQRYASSGSIPALGLAWFPGDRQPSMALVCRIRGHGCGGVLDSPRGLRGSNHCAARLLNSACQPAHLVAHWCSGMAAMGITCAIVALPYPLLAGKITSKQIPFAKIRPAPVYALQQAHAAAAGPPGATQPAKLRQR